ncbi:MAG TPA: choice-of-anchor Q domain-containing protein [Solirubrobacterales bacterium]
MSFRRSATGVLSAVAGLLLVVAPAQAVTYTVTRTDDPAPGPCLPADCSLREALNASNESTTVDDLVEVPAATERYDVDLGGLPINDEVEVRGEGADRVILDAEGNSPVVSIGGGASAAVLVGLTITGGEDGGIQNNGTLTLRGVSVQHNISSIGGGAIQSNGPVTIESSFVGFNRTDGGVGGAIHSNGPVTVVNSTVAWNSTDGFGGISGNDPVTLTSSAVVFNRSDTSAGAGASGDPLTLRDSILAGNRDGKGIANCVEAAISMGGNVEDAATCGLGGNDRPNTDPGLGPLGLHGGTTLVHSLLPGGGAVDAAGTCPALDQRGGLRPLGVACDSGPFELEPQPPPPLVVSPADEVVALGIAGRRLRINRRGVARLTLTCPRSEESPPCSGRVVLRTRRTVRFKGGKRRVVLAKAGFRIGAAGSRRVGLKLARAKLELVRSERSARRALAIIRVSDTAGNTRVIRRGFGLIPPR